jgi:hypothetical protein
MRDDDIPSITCGVLPFSFSHFDPLDDRPALPSAQRDAHDEICKQLFHYLQIALQAKDDGMRPFRIMATAEKLLAEYVDADFDMLEPLRADLAHTVRVAARMARRFFLKRAFSCSAETYPFYQQALREFDWHLGDPMLAEDYQAVRAHLDYGRALFAEIHRRTRRSLT